MNILKTAKLLTLNVGKSIGAFHVLSRSNWRKQRLLILAYHGVSVEDEHLWNPDLYVTPEYFRSRMQALKNCDANVFSLAEALEKLWSGTLPPCSVALTFDDGTADFYSRAFPILREFGWPATVYLTSYYSKYNRPVFDTMCSYLLWKGRGTVLNVNGLMNGFSKFDLSNAVERQRVTMALRTFSRQERFSAEQKDQLLTAIAGRLDLDYQAILSKRILHLMSVEELAAVTAGGVNVQLHTHRHHAPKTRDSFLHELEENRDFITAFTQLPHHFSYPNGMYEPCYVPWLEAGEVSSATTCEPGLATNRSDRYKLPRLVDTSSLRLVELEGWISGFSDFLPHRPVEAAVVIPPFYY